MEELNKDELISKYLAGEAGPEEAMELEDWKEFSAENMAYYMECEKLFFATGQFKILTDTDVKTALNTVKGKLEYNEKGTPVFKLSWTLRIAAAVVLLIGAAVVFNYYSKSSDINTTYAASDTEKKVVLGENTSVTIDPNSSITVNEGFGKTNRLVKLSGSAYFEVTHSDQNPMLVDAGHVYIKDIGTKFKITTSYNKDTVSVAVREGIVLLYDSLGAEITLNEGQSAAYIKPQKKIIAPQKEAKTTSFTFAAQSLKEVLGKLSIAFNTSIIIENRGIENCRITAKFSGEELETMLDIITETLELTFEKTNNGYVIKGDRCND